MFRYASRFAAMLVRILLKPKRLTILDTSIINGRVMPGDVDFNVHLNNGLVQTSMDFGRYDLLIRAGILQFVIKEKWRPIAGSTLIAFRKSLPLFAAYAIHSRIIGWDDKWVYFEQKIVHQGKIAVHAFLKALMRGPGGNIPPPEIALRLGVNPESPALPQVVTEWKKADALMFQNG